MARLAQSFTRRMEAAKVAAKVARNTGRHVGASAKGWNWKRQDIAAPSFADYARLAFLNWQADAREARNAFAAACLNGPQAREVDCEIPF